MNRDRILSIIRTVFSIGGALLLGHNLFGTVINESIVQEITGALMGIVAIVMSVLDKTATIEMVQGALRQGLKFVGGLLIASGRITAEQITLWSGLAVAAAPIIYGWLSRKKTQALDSGALSIDKLKK